MTELSYERRGSGPPIVLIHGLGSHRQMWNPVLDQIAQKRDVIAIDLPGFGESPLAEPASETRPTAGAAAGSASAADSAPADSEPPGSAGSASAGSAGSASAGSAATGPEAEPATGSVARLADQVESFLGRLGIERPEVAGSSLGGGIALELGRRGHARAVTAFAPIGFWSVAGRHWSQSVVTAARAAARRLDGRLPQIMASPAGRAGFCALFYARPRQLDPADAVAAARALAAAPGFDAARDAFAGLRPWAFAETGGLTRIPVTIAWGTRDAVLPFPQSRRARAVLPTARHVTLARCGHLPFADDPAACVAALSEPAR